MNLTRAVTGWLIETHTSYLSWVAAHPFHVLVSWTLACDYIVTQGDVMRRKVAWWGEKNLSVACVCFSFMPMFKKQKGFESRKVICQPFYRRNILSGAPKKDSKNTQRLRELSQHSWEDKTTDRVVVNFREFSGANVTINSVLLIYFWHYFWLHFDYI